MKRYCKPSTMSCDQTGVTRWRTFAMHHQPRSPALRLQLWIQENLNSFVSPSTVNQILTKTVLLKCFQTSQFHSSFGSWKVPHLCPSVDTQVLVSSMWVPPTWVGNPSRMLGCSDGLKSMPPARRKGGCWKGVFFFCFFEEIQVIWLVNLQWNMLVPRCIEPCRVVWTCQVNLDTHLLDPSTTNTVHSWASARCQCWGWQFCCLRKTQPDLGNFHWQGRGGHLGPSVWQVRLLGVGQSEAMDCQFGTGRNSTRSSYPWLKGAVFLVPWKTTSCPK